MTTAAAEGAAMSDQVTVKCWKCAGSGTFAYGTCFGCDGSGVNVYTKKAYARKVAAAKGRKSAAARRNEEARAVRDAELAAKTLAEMIEEVRYMCCVGHDGLVEAEAANGETERITVEEMARRIMVGT